MNRKIIIHTTIKASTYHKLKDVYGNGYIGRGIENAFELAEKKTYTIKDGIIKVVERLFSEIK